MLIVQLTAVGATADPLCRGNERLPVVRVHRLRSAWSSDKAFKTPQELLGF